MRSAMLFCMALFSATGCAAYVKNITPDVLDKQPDGTYQITVEANSQPSIFLPTFGWRRMEEIRPGIYCCVVSIDNRVRFVTVPVVVSGVKKGIDLRIRYPVHTLRVFPAHSVIQRGGRVLLEADAKDEYGFICYGLDIKWQSSHPDKVEVDEKGCAFAKAAGKAIITALCQGNEGTAFVEVVEPVWDPKIQIVPSYECLLIGERLRFCATCHNSAGVTACEEGFVWKSSDPNIALVNSDGILLGINEGQTEIVARCKHNIQGKARVIVAR